MKKGGRYRVGMEVRFFEWVVDTHVVHRALLRDWAVTGRAQLSYYDGASTNVANIEHIETYGLDLDENNYWVRNRTRNQNHTHSKPYVNTPKPEEGNCVWLWRWSASDSEHLIHPAIVRNVGPGVPPNTIGVFYIHRATGVRTPVNGVTPFAEIEFPTEDNYWARRRINGAKRGGQ